MRDLWSGLAESRRGGEAVDVEEIFWILVTNQELSPTTNIRFARTEWDLGLEHTFRLPFVVHTCGEIFWSQSKRFPLLCFILDKGVVILHSANGMRYSVVRYFLLGGNLHRSFEK